MIYIRITLFCFMLSVLLTQTLRSQDINLENAIYAYFERGAYQKVVSIAQKTEISNDKLLEIYGISLYHAKKRDNAAQQFARMEQKSAPALFFLAKISAQQQNIAQSIDFLIKHTKKSEHFPITTLKSDSVFLATFSAHNWKTIWATNAYSDYELAITDADYYIKLGKHEPAFDILDRLIEKYPHHHAAYYSRAGLYTELSDYKNALKDMNRCLSINSQETRYYKMRAEIYRKLNKTSKALEDAELAMQQTPKSFAMKLVGASILYEAKKYVAAEKLLQQYLNYIQDNDTAFALMAGCNAAQGNLLDAAKNYSNAIELNKYQPQWYAGRAEVYMQTHSYAYAELDYTKALDYEPVNTKYYIQRGWARHHQDNNKGACHDWQKALRLGDYGAEKPIYKYCKNAGFNN